LTSCRRLAVVCVALALLAGCGGSSPGSGATGKVNRDATVLLDTWRPQLVAAILAQGSRARAAQAGHKARAALLERQALTKLRPVEKFGRDARSRLLDSPRSATVLATIAAGDAWTEWAYTLRTAPPRGNFTQARHIADLAIEAVRRYDRAYRLLGRQPPPEFRVR
jgi:hypothetical protein